MSPSAFVAYIDESGDEGWRFGGGSSEWLVLSAAVFWKESELEEVKLIDVVREKLNSVRQAGAKFLPEKKPLHFRDLRHEQKKFFVGQIAQARLRTVTVCVHKPSLENGKSFRGESRLYFFSARLLIERIARLVRELGPLDCATDLCFSSRSTMDYAGLWGYLNRLDEEEGGLGPGGWPGVFSEERLTVYTPGQRMGLQIADAVASSYYLALEPNAYGDTEDSYVRVLLPKAAVVGGNRWGEGVKIVPEKAEERQKDGGLNRGF